VRKSLQPAGGQTPERGLGPSATVQPLIIGAAITFYAAWNARGLLAAWLHSPYDRFDPSAFAFWLLPIAVIRTLHRPGRPLSVGIAPFAIALLVSFAGVAVDLRSLEYLSLAVALSGFIPFRPATLPWLLCAIAWMPGAGWAFSSHGPLFVNVSRLACGLLSVALTPLLFPRDE
jgi:hypothetical protein